MTRSPSGNAVRPAPLELLDPAGVRRPFHEVIAAFMEALGLTGFETAELLRTDEPSVFTHLRNTTISRWLAGPDGTWGQVPRPERQKAAHAVLRRALSRKRQNERRRQRRAGVA